MEKDVRCLESKEKILHEVLKIAIENERKLIYYRIAITGLAAIIGGLLVWIAFF